jgi:hypothetical protein
MADAFVVSNREQPASQIPGVRPRWVGDKRGHQGVLETVVHGAVTDEPTQIAVNVTSMRINERLEGRQSHLGNGVILAAVSFWQQCHFGSSVIFAAVSCHRFNDRAA